jgi:prevent-host-death family protein
VTAGALRARLGEILDRASAGERIVVERDHKPIAVLVSPEDAGRLEPNEDERLARNLAALDRLAAFRERMAQEHPWPDDAPDAVTAVRDERARDDRARADRPRDDPR